MNPIYSRQICLAVVALLALQQPILAFTLREISDAQFAPVAVTDDNVGFSEDVIVGNLLLNDFIPLSSSSLFVDTTAASFGPVNGTVTILQNGFYSYQPDSGFSGEDSFTYRVCEIGDPTNCSLGVIYIDVIGIPGLGVNHAPRASGDAFILMENSTFSNNLILNDSDPDNDVFFVSVTPVVPPQNGLVSMMLDGSFSYVPLPDFVGNDEFIYEICDGVGGCDQARVGLSVLEDTGTVPTSNPFCGDDEFAGRIGESLNGNLLLNDYFLNSGPLYVQFLLNETPENGSINVASSGDFIYTPNPGFSGKDRLVYLACDTPSGGNCSSGEVNLIIYPPVCLDLDISLWMEGPFDTQLGSMVSALNEPLGLLPGQTPLSPFGVATLAGQPYNQSPWNYEGTFLESNFSGPYPPDVIDWVLISVREGVAKTTQIGIAAGLVRSDGSVTLVEPCMKVPAVEGPLNIVVEHRNHMGIMTDVPKGILNFQSISHDFRWEQSYRENQAFGQKQVLPGVFAMYTGDCWQDDFPSYDINGQDAIIWTIQNGIFNQYLLSDFNLDGDVNGLDATLWSANSGIYSSVPKN